MERRPTLLNSCASAASAQEARFRIQNPNSLGRHSRIVALDRGAEQIVREVADDEWFGARFLTTAGTTSHPDAGLRAEELLLETLDGESNDLDRELEGADVAVMVASGSGWEARGAAAIGRACFDRRIMTAGIVLSGDDADDAVAQMRPFASVLVVSADPDYLSDMLHALRA